MDGDPETLFSPYTEKAGSTRLRMPRVERYLRLARTARGRRSTPEPHQWLCPYR